jgi:hypothetical protein
MPQIVSQLLSPANSIVVTFDHLGGVAVKHLQKKGALFIEVETASLKSISSDHLDFEFKIDDTANNAAPDAGLIIDSDAYWPDAWDAGNATVLGGIVFPFGNEAVQAPVDNNGSTDPQRKYVGTFKTSAAGWQVIHADTSRLSTDTLTGDPKGVPMKCLALCLPKGVSGQVTFSNWSAAGAKTVRVQADKKPAAKAAKGGKGKG